MKPTTPPAAERALTVRLRHNPASSLTGGPIVEDATGAFFCECSLLTDADRIIEAVNAHAAAQQRIGGLEKALEKALPVLLNNAERMESLAEKAMGTQFQNSADELSKQADNIFTQARLALRRPERT